MSGPASNLEKTLRTKLFLHRAAVGALLLWFALPPLVAVFHPLGRPGSVSTPQGMRILSFVWAAVAIPASVFFRSKFARQYEQHVAKGYWPQRWIRLPGNWRWRHFPAKPTYMVSPTEEALRWWELYSGSQFFEMIPILGAANLLFLIFAIDQDLLDLATGVCFYALLVPMWPQRVRFDSGLRPDGKRSNGCATARSRDSSLSPSR